MMGNKIIEALSEIATSSLQITPDILVLQFRVVNACVVSNLGDKADKWVLVDTGLENSADFIIDCAAKKFGADSKPDAIILTHGHFDHVGSVIKLSKYWDAPVYIHELEMPYVTDKKDYPMADPEVDEGLVAKMSPSFPHTSIDLGDKVRALPPDGSIPPMPGWIYIHTPGHSEGNISLFNEKEKILIAGDAFSTLKQESLMAVITQKESISGPPKYLTIDWAAAKKSIERLSKIYPKLAIPSHGQPMEGESLETHLDYLLYNFDEIAKPEKGRFVDNNTQ